VHLGELVVAYVGRTVATPRLFPGRDQCVEQARCRHRDTGLDDHVLVDAQELAEGEELILAGVARRVLTFVGVGNTSPGPKT